MVCEISRRNYIELISILTVFILLISFMLPFINGLAQPLPGNPPVANAGPDKNANTAQWINFNGNGSFDPDSDPLQYKWDFGDGNSTGYSSNGSVWHLYTSPGNYKVDLNVTDGSLYDNDTCFAWITSGPPSNKPPVSNAGQDQNALVFQIVNFDGSNSYDPENVSLYYKWHYGDNISTNWQTDPNTTHSYGQIGSYNVTLTVSDGFISDYDICIVNVSSAGGGGSKPVADAGSNQFPTSQQTIYFDGSGSYDPDSDPIKYNWHFGDGNTTGWQTNPNASHNYFYLSTYYATLYVSDGTLMDSDQCTIKFTINHAPVAKLGPDMNVTVNMPVFFDGTNSYDPDNDILLYKWEFGDGNATGWVSSTAKWHNYTVIGIYDVKLTVSDGELTNFDICKVWVNKANGTNTAPVANAGPDRYVNINQTVYLNGNGSYDPDNDPLTYKWYFGDGSSTGWQSSSYTSHSYNAVGNYTAMLNVTDGELNDIDYCIIHVSKSGGSPNSAPVANAGSDKYAKIDQTVYFDGSGSYDPDNDPLTYKWYFGDGSTTGWQNTSKALHSYSKTGNYTAKLTVFDGAAADNDTCIVHITLTGGGNNTNSAPVADAGPDQNGTVNQQVYFDGSGSYDPDNDPLTYKWHFGDGYQSGWQGNCNASHTYNSTGNYTATIYVSDSKLVDSDSCVIYVTDGGWGPFPPRDSDDDGYFDDVDAFPDDPTQWQDSDGDGYGDNIDGDNPDIFPADPNEWSDMDLDGIGDNSDAFPDDHTEWTDTDGDGVGDNTDKFPNDASDWSDLDGDKIGDNFDAFPRDPTEWKDTDGDGVGDNSDAYPDDPSRSVKTNISEGDEPDIFVYVSVIVLVMIILIIIKLVLIVRKNRRRGGNGPIDNDKLLQQIQDDIIDGKVLVDTELSQEELGELLESSYRNGEISKGTYHYIVDNDLIGYSK